MSGALYRHTPSLSVCDSRQRVVATVAYWRDTPQATAEARTGHAAYDPADRSSEQWDARLWALHQEGIFLTPNLALRTSLGGRSLSSQSVDAGWRVALPGDDGQMHRSWDGRGNQWRLEQDSIGRPLTLRETVEDGAERVAERYAYASAGPSNAEHNRCGRLLRHDDNAGSHWHEDHSLSGQATRQRDICLKALDPPDWPEASAARDALLAPDTQAVSRWRVAPDGLTIDQTDAGGHTRHVTYDIAGQQLRVDLVVQGATLRTLLHQAHYDARGNLEHFVTGNEATHSIRFEPVSARLVERSTRRATGEYLQSLHFDQDPAGNIVRITDLAKQTQFHANQRIDAVDEYGYDTLGRLISATGREAADAITGPDLPAWGPVPVDDSQLQNYSQTYQYDCGNNLTELRHVGKRSYTRRMQVDPFSNRAILADSRGSLNESFDVNGNLLYLEHLPTLRWDASNQLASVTTVTRTGPDDDGERYIYDSAGTRRRKVSQQQAGSQQHRRETRYLPGLEIQTDSATDDHLEVIVVSLGGCSLRCLHWRSGKPADIEQDQMRYSVEDQLGSGVLELDQEGRLVNEEGYYPFGGTAWHTARSAVEANYRTVRYSGKERDRSGLYYYGYRYYAPWLQRWTSCDPAGPVDGLNLYTMTGNSPISYFDVKGRMMESASSAETLSDPEGRRGSGASSQTATPPTSPRYRSGEVFDLTARENLEKIEPITEKINRTPAAKKYGLLSPETVKNIKSSLPNTKKNRNLLSELKAIKSQSAYAKAFDGPRQLSSDGMTNIVTPFHKMGGIAKNGASNDHTLEKNGVRYHKVIDTDSFLASIDTEYKRGGRELHPIIEKRIRAHIIANNGEMPNKDGVVGLHAEVRAVNQLLHLLPHPHHADPTRTRVATFRTDPAYQNAPFKACSNCYGVLNGLVKIVTDPTGEDPLSMFNPHAASPAANASKFDFPDIALLHLNAPREKSGRRRTSL